ncbi:MAG: hypothetical protein ABI867_03025 [Kofleriaceae bacterium]
MTRRLCGMRSCAVLQGGGIRAFDLELERLDPEPGEGRVGVVQDDSADTWPRTSAMMNRSVIVATRPPNSTS